VQQVRVRLTYSVNPTDHGEGTHEARPRYSVHNHGAESVGLAVRVTEQRQRPIDVRFDISPGAIDFRPQAFSRGLRQYDMAATVGSDGHSVRSQSPQVFPVQQVFGGVRFDSAHRHDAFD
jgi:hypothetical protein